LNKESIYHAPSGEYGYLLSPDTFSITIRAQRGDLRHCYLYYGDVWAPIDSLRFAEMEKIASDDLFDYFRKILRAPSRRLRYFFRLDDGKESLWYSESGFSPEKPRPRELGLPFFEVLYMRENDVVATPEWAKGAVIYQIFPDRFYNGDESNDLPNVSPWDSTNITDETYFGGDIKGIIQKLSYLSELGVEAIYLNPIFSSPSPHKYDAIDYYQIDPSLGDLKALDELIKRSHELDIKLILDGVFDHCGIDFWAFQDVVKKGKESKYVDWFKIHGFPIKTTPKPSYETWGKDIWWMPRLMTHNPEVVDYFVSVGVHWIERGVDGWRLDVASEVDHRFWQEFRRAVKKANPEAILIGEVAHDASSWLQGDQLDSVMNYPLRQLIIDFFATGAIRVEDFDSSLAKLRVRYRDQINQVLYNMLGSHDTARFLSLCNNQRERMMLAVIFQMTYLGMPAIYYGDEVGMTSGKNVHDSRRAMEWDEKKQDQRMLDLFRKLVSIRRKSLALRRGDFLTTHADSKANTYAYIRRLEDERVLVVLNNSPSEQGLAISGEAIGLTDGEMMWNELDDAPYRIDDGKLKFLLKAYSGLILSSRQSCGSEAVRGA